MLYIIVMKESLKTPLYTNSPLLSANSLTFPALPTPANQSVRTTEKHSEDSTNHRTSFRGAHCAIVPSQEEGSWHA